MLIPFGVFSAAGAGGGAAAGSYELISTAYGTGSSGTIEFTSIPQTYKHLQIRFTAKAVNSYSYPTSGLYMATDTYPVADQTHYLRGNGSAVQSGITTLSYSNWPIQYSVASNTTANLYSSGIMDILDYSATTKNKTLRSFTGLNDGSKYVVLASALVQSTSAINEWRIYCDGNFASGSRFSLYGIKG